MLKFSLLGAIEVRTPTRAVRPRGTIQQTLLAALLVRNDRLNSVTTLAEELWGTTPPEKVENALQAHICRLRRLLASLEPGERDQRQLVTGMYGYRLEVDGADIDASVFLHRIDAVRRQLGADPHHDIAELRRTLAMWRGPVFGGITGGPICHSAASKYLEARQLAQELLYDTELKLGGHGRVLPELTELANQNPTQEHFCSLLMVALYRAGRQVDALTVYRQFRQRLAESLGVNPSPMLQQFERAILNHDPVLLGAQGLPRPSAPSALVSVSPL